MSTDSSLPVVLCTLGIKRRGQVPDIAEASGIDADTVEALLARGADEELVTVSKRRGWVLTETGREEVRRLRDEERAEVDTTGATAAYEREFLVLNTEFKELCTRWQLGERDTAARAEIGPDLDGVHERAHAFLDEVAPALRRSERYRSRLDAAHQRFRGGDAAALTRPLSGSYHDVWVELHEDLVVLLEQVRDADD